MRLQGQVYGKFMHQVLLNRTSFWYFSMLKIIDKFINMFFYFSLYYMIDLPYHPDR